MRCSRRGRAAHGASLLISVLGRRERIVRTVSCLLTCMLLACDTMIADRMIVRTPADMSGTALSSAELLATTRVALDDCGLLEADISAHRDTLHWRNPKRPPGLHVMIHTVDDGLRITLAQDL